MRYVLLLITLTFNFTFNSYCQTIFNIEKVITFGTANADGLKSVVANDNNIFVTGYFSDSLIIGNQSLKSNGANDIFIGKFDYDLNPIWIKGFGSNYIEELTISEYGNSIAIDSDDNIYVTGLFYGTLVFGNSSITSLGIGDMFVMKLDKDGNPIWIKKIAGISQNIGNSINVDEENRVIVTGLNQHVLHIDSLTFPNSYNSMFIVRYNSNGKLDLVKQINSYHGIIQGKTVKTDINNNIYISGVFTDTLSVDSITIKTQGKYDFFIAKLNDIGDILWLNHYGNVTDDNIESFDINEDGSLILTGGFYDTLAIGTEKLISNGSNDIFIIKLDNDGNEIWSKSLGSIDYENATSIRYDNNEIVFTGVFYNNFNLGDSVLTSLGGPDVYYIKLNQEGELIDHYSFGGEGQDLSNDFFLKNEFLFGVGTFIDKLILDNKTYYSKGFVDAWLIKFNKTIITSVSSYFNNSEILFYPNPFQNQLHYKLNSNERIQEIRLYNTSGKLIRIIEPITSDQVIELNDLPDDLYLLNFIYGNNIITKRIVKMTHNKH